MAKKKAAKKKVSRATAKTLRQHKQAHRSYFGGKRSRSRKTHNRNPTQLLFRTKKAARAYAKAHGAKKFSIRKLKKGQ
jgi:hypothetical protein